MTATNYDYSFATDFDSALNEAKLRDEINLNDSIIPHCSNVGRAGDVVTITFMGPLSTSEQNELEGDTIPNHDGLPYPDDTQTVEVVNRIETEVRKPDGL